MKKDNKNNLDNLRHSCAHLLAATVLELWPGTKNAIGPSIENGFYQDFDFSQSTKQVSELDLPEIEERMRKKLKSWDSFEIKKVFVKQAKKDFAWNPYKSELVVEFASQGKTLTETKQGGFLDLCKGGHIKNPSKELKHFKLLSIAGAYWRGSEKNQMLTRIYGTAWPTKKELDNHLKSLEEAKESDHRKIGKDLGLFAFSDLVGKGLPMLTSKGATIRRELERFILDEEIKRGYKHVLTPPIAKTDLYRLSGHYPYYKDTMYPVMKVDDDELILRPMTCPHHFMLYKSEPHTYKELPLKIAELAQQFRYEKSGELSGLMRVRVFCLSDAHIICTPGQAKAVIIEVLELIDFANKVFGMEKRKDYRYRLSLGDRSDKNEKYYKDDKAWEAAENILREVLVETKAPFFEGEGEAAFYGPKIDIQVKNISGHEETAFTVQYDFVMPQRFELEYIDQDGQKKQPIVIHRSAIGAFERLMAFLIEHYKGAFPVWLAPTQVIVLPITDKNLNYARFIEHKLKTAGVRVELNSRAETLQTKIRDAQLQKIPYMLIVGNREEENKTVAVRLRSGEDLGALTFEEFLGRIKRTVEARAGL